MKEPGNASLIAAPGAWKNATISTLKIAWKILYALQIELPPSQDGIAATNDETAATNDEIAALRRSTQV